MTKKWKVEGKSASFDTLEAALDVAKRYASGSVDGYGVYELVAIAKSKTPDVDVIMVK